MASSPETVAEIVENLRNYSKKLIPTNPDQALRLLQKANQKIHRHVIKGRALTFVNDNRTDYMNGHRSESQYQTWSDTESKK